MKIKISKIKVNQLFEFEGEIYKFLHANQSNNNWLVICNANGDIVPKPPVELLMKSTIVEVKESK